MAEDERREREQISVTIANEMVSFANDKLDTGVSPIVVAAALRHAAANFTAFAHQSIEGPLDVEGVVQDFLGYLEFYDKHHRSKARPMTGLEQLVAQVEQE